MRRLLSPIHRGLVHLVTLAVFGQAVLAGQFVSGLSDQLALHGAVGGLLELTGLVLLLVATAHRIAGERSRGALWGSVALAVALQVQAGLGWAPGALPTAIHVPLGVAIFAGAVALSGSIGRSLTTPTREPWQGRADQTRTATSS